MSCDMTSWWCYKYIPVRLLKLCISQNKTRCLEKSQPHLNQSWNEFLSESRQHCKSYLALLVYTAHPMGQTRFYEGFSSDPLFSWNCSHFLSGWQYKPPSLAPDTITQLLLPVARELHLLIPSSLSSLTAGYCTGLEDTYKVRRGSGPPDLPAVLQQLHTS